MPTNIAAITDGNGILRPATPINFSKVSGVTFDGTRYTVYAQNETPPAPVYNDQPIQNVLTETQLQGLLKNPTDIVEFKKYYASIISKTVADIDKLAVAAADEVIKP